MTREKKNIELNYIDPPLTVNPSITVAYSLALNNTTDMAVAIHTEPYVLETQCTNNIYAIVLTVK